MRITTSTARVVGGFQSDIILVIVYQHELSTNIKYLVHYSLNCNGTLTKNNISILCKYINDHRRPP